MEDIVDIIIYGIIGIIILVISVIIYSIRKARKNRKKRRELEANLTTAIEEHDSKNVASSNMKLIVKFYEQNLLQHRMTFISTLIIASLGFIAILVGLLLIFSQKYTGDRNIAYMTTAGGLIAELISALFFTQNRQVMKQLRENHQDLQKGLDIENAISLAENLPEEDKNIEMKKIIDLLLQRVTTETPTQPNSV